MVDTGIFATTAEILAKAGANASAVSTSETYTNQYIAEAEGYINGACRFNFSDNYAALNADVKGAIKEVASNLAAIYVIQYDMSDFSSRTEAEDMINILRDASLRGIAVLKEKKAQDFIKGA